MTTSTGNKDVLILTAPTTSMFNQFKRHSIQFKKDDLWGVLRMVINTLATYKEVKWNGEINIMKTAGEATRTIIAKRSMASKDCMETFYAVFFGRDFNILTIADMLIPMKGGKLAKIIVENGAVNFSELAEFMRWPAFQYPYWSYSVNNNETYRRWTTSIDTQFLNLMCDTVYGADYLTKTRSNRTTYPYIIPNPILIEYVLGKQNASVPVTTINDPKEYDGNLILFNGNDFFGTEDTILTLIKNGSLPSGKTKIPVATVKKFSTYIPLRQFPCASKNSVSRAEYLTTLAMLVFGEPDDMVIKNTRFSQNGFMKLMFNNLRCKSPYFLQMVLSKYAKFNYSDFIHHHEDWLAQLFSTIEAVLSEGVSHQKKGWISYQSFFRRVDYLLATSKLGYIVPIGKNDNPENVRDANGEQMPVTDFKANIHDRLISGIIMGLASLGAITLYMHPEGEIAYLRLTDAGSWFYGKSQNAPEPVETNNGDSLDIDDATGIIIVKDDEYPYIGVLTEFADKITERRFCVSKKALLKGCASTSDLDSKIGRYRALVQKKPGPRMKKFFDSLLAKCDLVKKTPGGSTYQLYDIDSEDIELHKLIINNPEIRDNVLRVEGCRLLIKTKFIPDFFEKLRKAGYLID